jgi:hypothetical protein
VQSVNKFGPSLAAASSDFSDDAFWNWNWDSEALRDVSISDRVAACLGDMFVVSIMGGHRDTLVRTELGYLTDLLGPDRTVHSHQSDFLFLF